MSLFAWRLLLGVGFCQIWTPAPAATFDCVMDPSLSLKIGSPVSSTLSAVLVKRGDRVAKGQVIARLESAVEESTVALNEARASSLAEVSARRVRLEQAATELNRGPQPSPHFLFCDSKVVGLDAKSSYHRKREAGLSDRVTAGVT